MARRPWVIATMTAASAGCAADPTCLGFKTGTWGAIHGLASSQFGMFVVGPVSVALLVLARMRSHTGALRQDTRRQLVHLAACIVLSVVVTMVLVRTVHTTGTCGGWDGPGRGELSTDTVIRRWGAPAFSLEVWQGEARSSRLAYAVNLGFWFGMAYWISMLALVRPLKRPPRSRGPDTPASGRT